MNDKVLKRDDSGHSFFRIFEIPSMIFCAPFEKYRSELRISRSLVPIFAWYLRIKNCKNMKKIVYHTTGTCSRAIELSGEDGRIVDVAFYGGCNGNLQGISSLVKGMKYEDVIARLKGISCNGKPTSCPDQLCCAIEALKNEE